eukprot:577006-Alexandrium_andersonii.AAC.1
MLQGRTASGANRTAEAAACPPALCAAILRGIAARRAGEGRVAPTHAERRLKELRLGARRTALGRGRAW